MLNFAETCFYFWGGYCLLFFVLFFFGGCRNLEICIWDGVIMCLDFGEIQTTEFVVFFLSFPFSLLFYFSKVEHQE